MSTREFGLFAEGIARHYLIKKGYKILASNFKLKFGELDIVAQKEDKIIFFEVKALKNSYEDYNPEMRVDYKKKNKLIKLGQAFMLYKKLDDVPWQIDVISVTLDPENRPEKSREGPRVTFTGKAKIKHFKNAFSDN
ncbi:MAG: YraN family protein [Patescibacteria group bacterium]